MPQKNWRAPNLALVPSSAVHVLLHYSIFTSLYVLDSVFVCMSRHGFYEYQDCFSSFEYILYCILFYILMLVKFSFHLQILSFFFLLLFFTIHQAILHVDRTWYATIILTLLSSPCSATVLLYSSCWWFQFTVPLLFNFLGIPIGINSYLVSFVILPLFDQVIN